MFKKTFTTAFLAIWLVNACLAAPAPEPEPCGGCGNGCGCSIEKCHTVPVTSTIPIKTSHKIICDKGCGCGSSHGWGYGSDQGCGCGCGSIGWGGNWGNDGCCECSQTTHYPITTFVPIRTRHTALCNNQGYGHHWGSGCGCGSSWGNGCGSCSNGCGSSWGNGCGCGWW